MKIKKLYTIFNIVIFLSLFSIFFIPILIVDFSYLGVFWKLNWWVLCVFVCVIVVVNAIFLFNWKTFVLLEAQDWVGLSHYLEKKIKNCAFFSKRTAVLYIESLFLIGDFSSISSFERMLKKSKPLARSYLAPRFLASLVVSLKIADARLMCDELINTGKKIDEWVYFYRGFIENQAGDFHTASVYLSPLSVNSSNPLITALSGFLLLKRILPSGCVDEVKIEENIDVCKGRISRTYTIENWKKLLDESRADIHSVVFSSMFAETTEWLFS